MYGREFGLHPSEWEATGGLRAENWPDIFGVCGVFLFFVFFFLRLPWILCIKKKTEGGKSRNREGS